VLATQDSSKILWRLDDRIAVSVPVLNSFLQKKSPTFVCRLVQHHHAKVIWWRGVGVYIGSANLTNSAWYTNVEAGCFFSEEEITDDMAEDLLDLFATLECHSTPLTEELLEVMNRRVRQLTAALPIQRHSGLVQALPDGQVSFGLDQNKQRRGNGKFSFKSGIPHCSSCATSRPRLPVSGALTLLECSDFAMAECGVSANGTKPARIGG
jgi:hypothetical protein